MKKTSLTPNAEHQLLSRLKILGIILFIFGFVALTYGLVTTPQEHRNSLSEYARNTEVETAGPQELSVPELRRDILYLAVASFWIIGTASFVFALRRKAQLKS